MDLPEPFNLYLDEFLEGEEGRLDLDDIFAKELDDVLSQFEAQDITPDSKDPGYHSMIEPGYLFKDVPAGILLYDETGTIVGAYLCTDLVLAPEHRGKGLGLELVIERCLRDGENPVLNLDKSAYSHAGARAHMNAWTHTQTYPEETQARYARWSGKS